MLCIVWVGGALTLSSYYHITSETNMYVCMIKSPSVIFLFFYRFLPQTQIHQGCLYSKTYR